MVLDRRPLPRLPRLRLASAPWDAASPPRSRPRLYRGPGPNRRAAQRLGHRRDQHGHLGGVARPARIARRVANKQGGVCAARRPGHPGPRVPTEEHPPGARHFPVGDLDGSWPRSTSDRNPPSPDPPVPRLAARAARLFHPRAPVHVAHCPALRARALLGRVRAEARVAALAEQLGAATADNWPPGDEAVDVCIRSTARSPSARGRPARPCCSRCPLAGGLAGATQARGLGGHGPRSGARRRRLLPTRCASATRSPAASPPDLPALSRRAPT